MPVKRRRARALIGLKRSRARSARWSLAVHGGASTVRDEALNPAREAAVRAALQAVLEDVAKTLAGGASSLDAVEEAVRRLEDSPLFNAGKGAVFNSHGEHELEASIMDGRTLAAGAVAAVRGGKNPVMLARRIMERTPHVYLQGDGALAFARAEGMEIMAPDYFWTEERWASFKEARLSAAGRRAPADRGSVGTVGAVAFDRYGNLAAATSTGGMTNKMPGRVGDSSVIGAGTYASNTSCAVSCTGHGEYFIRATVARDICARIEYAGSDARAAVQAVLGRRLGRLGGRGGAILVDRAGQVLAWSNTEVMYRGAVTHKTPARTAIYRRDAL
jgi:beta-aspartyl-peptidase (threonine type)